MLIFPRIIKQAPILILLLMVASCQVVKTEAAVPPTNNSVITVDETETAVTATIYPTPQPITLHTGDEVRLLWTQQKTVGAFLAEIGMVVEQTDQVFADQELVPRDALDQWPLPKEVEIGRYFTITIQDDEQQQIISTAVQTVAEALEEAGVSLFAADIITPPPESELTQDLVIQIQRSLPLTIQADGRIVQIRSIHTNAHDVLGDAGIALVDKDFTQPGPEMVLQSGDTVQVIRVTEDFRLEDEPLPYQTLWQASSELDLDTQAPISPGVPGIKRRRIRVRYENGVEISQMPDGEWVESEPINEVIGYGTRINIGVVETEQGPREYWRVVRMRVTSYTAASSGKSPDHPRYGITASGLFAGKGIVAVDRNIVPWKSEVFLEGYGVAIAGDTGGGVRGRWIDLGFDEDNFESWWGYRDVYFLTPVPPPENINYILPSVLP